MRGLLVLALLAALIPAAARPAGSTTRDVNGRLAFAVTDRDEVGGYAQVFVSDPDGRRAKAILSPPEGAGRYWDPKWSPAGEKVAASLTQSNRYTGTSSTTLYVANADGTGRRAVVEEPRLAEGSAAWSPDGLQLAYVTGSSPPEIHIVGSDGREQRRLTRGSSPTWSPDGRSMAFTRARSLFVIDVASGRETSIVSGGAAAPDWSPDGRLIAFAWRNAIHVLRPDGTGRRVVTRGRSQTAPAWSPDGSRIAFGCGGDVCIVDRSGRRVRNVTRTRSRDEGDPDWQPVRLVGNTIHGTRFDDYLAGSSGGQVIRGNAGNDVIAGGRGRDRLDGGPGNDVFHARDGERDLIIGRSGRDRAEADRRDRVQSVERVVRPG